MSDDDLDIYGDLVEFQEVEEKKSKELIAWEARYSEALKDNDSLRLENKDLLKKIKTIEVNFQNLLDTAKAEIERQKKVIAELRKEKDDICFRRKRPKLDENHEYSVGRQHIICEAKPEVTNKIVSLPDKSVVPVEEPLKNECFISEINKCINGTKTDTNGSKARHEKDMQRSQEHEYRPIHRRYDDVGSRNRHEKSYDHRHGENKRRRGNSCDRRDRYSKDDRRDLRSKTEHQREKEDSHERGDRHSKDERRIACNKTKEQREQGDSRDSAERYLKYERKVVRSKTEQQGQKRIAGESERPYLERDHKNVGERSNGDSDDTRHKERYKQNVKESKRAELNTTDISNCYKDLHNIEKLVTILNESNLDETTFLAYQTGNENTNINQGLVVTEIKPNKQTVSSVVNEFEVTQNQDTTTIMKPISSVAKISTESVVEITSTEGSNVTGDTAIQSHINQKFHSELSDKLISSTSNTDVNSNTITINMLASIQDAELSLSTPKKVALFNELFVKPTNICSKKVIPNSDLLKSVLNLLQSDTDKMTSQKYSTEEVKSKDDATKSSCIEGSMDSNDNCVINIDVKNKEDLHNLESNFIPGLDLLNTTHFVVRKIKCRDLSESQADVFMDLEDVTEIIRLDDDDKSQTNDEKPTNKSNFQDDGVEEFGCTTLVGERKEVTNKDSIHEVDLNQTLIKPLNNELKKENDLTKMSFELKCDGLDATKLKLKANENTKEPQIKLKSNDSKSDELLNINGSKKLAKPNDDIIHQITIANKCQLLTEHTLPSNMPISDQSGFITLNQIPTKAKHLNSLENDESSEVSRKNQQFSEQFTKPDTSSERLFNSKKLGSVCITKKGCITKEVSKMESIKSKVVTANEKVTQQENSIIPKPDSITIFAKETIIIDKEVATEKKILWRADVDDIISKKVDMKAKNHERFIDNVKIEPILGASKEVVATKLESPPRQELIAGGEITTDRDTNIKEEVDIAIKCVVTTKGEDVSVEEVASNIKEDGITAKDVSGEVNAIEKKNYTNKVATREEIITKDETIKTHISVTVPVATETDTILIGTKEIVTIEDAKRKTSFSQDVHIDSTNDASELSTNELKKKPTGEETIKKKELLNRPEPLKPDSSEGKLSMYASSPKSEGTDNICHAEVDDSAMTSTQYNSPLIIDGNSQDVAPISPTLFNEMKSKTFMSSTLLSEQDDKGAIELGLFNIKDNVNESADEVQLEQSQAIDAAVMLLEMANNSQNIQEKDHIEIIEDLRLPQKFTLNELNSNTQIKLSAEVVSVASDNRNEEQIIPSVENENAFKIIAEPITSSTSETKKSIKFIDDKVKPTSNLNDLESIPEISSDAIELALRALHDTIPLSPKKRYTRHTQQQSYLTTTNQDHDDLFEILSGNTKSADTTPVDTLGDGASFVCKVTKYKSNLSNLKIDEVDSKLSNSPVEEPNDFQTTNPKLIESSHHLSRLTQPSKSVSEIVVELQSIEVPKPKDVNKMHNIVAPLSDEFNLPVNFETNSNWKKFKIPKIKRTQDKATETETTCLNEVQSAVGNESNLICFEESTNLNKNGVERTAIDIELESPTEIPNFDIQDELEILNASGEKNTQPKRGRGRPRKHLVMAEKLPVKEKGKPGRKKRQVEDEHKNVSGESANSDVTEFSKSLPMAADKQVLGRELALNNYVSESKELKSVVSEKEYKSMFCMQEQESQVLHNLVSKTDPSHTCQNQPVFELKNAKQSKSLHCTSSPLYVPEKKRVRLSSLSPGETLVSVNQEQQLPLEESSMIVNANANITTNVTIDETIAPVIEDSACRITQPSNESNVSTNNGSIVTKRVSLGSTDYRFEQMPNNQIKLVVTRRGRKRKAAELVKTTTETVTTATTTAIVAVAPSDVASPTLPVIRIIDAMP